MKRPIAVGDFRPWIRMVVLLGGILAFGFAARSLSRHLREVQLRDALSELVESTARAAIRARPLLPLAGFPHCAAKESMQLGPLEASAVEGVVADSRGEPLEGATVEARWAPSVGSAPLVSSRTDAAGRFRLEGLSPREPLALIALPPAPLGELAALRVETIPEGLPGAARGVGILRLPRRVEVRLEVDAERAEGRAVAAWESPGAMAAPFEPLARDGAKGFRAALPFGLVELRAITGSRASRTRLLATGPCEASLAAPREALSPAVAQGPAAGRALFMEGLGPAEGNSLDGWLLLAPAGAAREIPSGVRLRELAAPNGEVASITPPFLLGAPPPDPVVPARCGMELRLRSGAGVPIAGASAWLDLFSSGVPRRIAIGAPIGDLPAGEHRLVACAEGHLPRSIDLTLPLAEERRTVDLVLERAAEVEITAEGAACVRISDAEGRSAVLAIPPSGALPLRSLPCVKLRFELLESSPFVLGGALPVPALDRTGVEVVRTLAPGEANATVILRRARPEPPRAEICAGGTRPGAWVYRSGAHFDEPAGITCADDLGRFRLAVVPGERVLAAIGPASRLLPFASAPAAPEVSLRTSRSLVVAVRNENDTPASGASVSVRVTGADALGNAAWSGTADPEGKARFDDLPTDVALEIAAELDRGRGLARLKLIPDSPETFEITLSSH